MQLTSVPRKLCSHHDKFVMAAQAGPLTRALALGVTVFAYPENFVTKSKILHITTSAKTRATAILRQQHLPPNVGHKFSTTEKYLIMRKMIFEKSKNTKTIIGIRLYGEEEDFWLGYIENFNDYIIQLRYFDKLGFEDGLVIERQENIDCIEYESEYEKSYEYLINKRNDLNKIERIVDFKDSENWRKEYLLEYEAKKEVISMQFNEETIIYGYINKVSDNEVIIDAIGHLGENEGMAIYRTNDMTAIRIADKKSKLRQELNNWRKK